MMSAQKRTFWLKACSLLGVVICLGYAFQSRFQIGIDPQTTLSMGKRIFLVDLKNQEIERGGVYVFRTKGAEPVYKDGTELVKSVVGVPGDTVEITPYFDILVNGKLVARGLWHVREINQDKVRERFAGKHVLKDDEFWMIGKSFKSFDSRYFGPVSSAQIKGKAYAIY